MRTTLPLLVALCWLAVLPAQRRRMNASGGVLRADQACFDVRHYTLRIDVDPAREAIDGQLTMRADAVGEVARLALDLEDRLPVASVRVDGADAKFTHEGGRIAIEPARPIPTGQAFEVEVRYGGKPRVAVRPPWNGGFTWSKTADGKPWIATTCQGEGADLWWPCKDHPSDKPDGFDLYCTVPDGLVVAGNGTLQGEPQLADGKRTFHWRSASPIANYNIALNIAPYVELKDTFACVDGTEMPITFYVLPRSVTAARRCMPHFLDHIKVFEELLGPYPFRHEKYGIAETPHLGMEHQTMIAYGNGFKEPQWDWLHNHELAHEWWGNLVTCRDWKDMWLHEGFGTYMQPLYRERRFGYDAYLAEMRQRRTINRVPMAPREVKDSKQIYFAGNNNDIYFKGSWVLHTLRFLIGDERFFTVLRRFAYPDDDARAATDGSQVRFVDTQEFVDLCSEVAGEDLGWFFEVYVRSAGLPRLEYDFADGKLQLAWQTPDDLPFPMPVALTISATEQRVEMPGGKAEIEVGDSEYKIDPLDRVLMAKPRRRE